jgi:uncharacterized protein (DUF2062 family)
MRIELVPLIVAAVIGLVALGLIADAWLPEEYYVTHERRRRRRTERHRVGEVLVGVGLLALAAALAGGDAWRYGTVAMIAGAVLLAVGAALNHRYLRELFSFRGASRRADPPPESPAASEADPPQRTRLR